MALIYPCVLCINRPSAAGLATQLELAQFKPRSSPCWKILCLTLFLGTLNCMITCVSSYTVYCCIFELNPGEIVIYNYVPHTASGRLITQLRPDYTVLKELSIFLSQSSNMAGFCSNKMPAATVYQKHMTLLRHTLYRV
jgi:hypothetical protein